MFKKLISASVIFAFAMPVVSLAEAEFVAESEHVAELDTDGDGTVSEAEYVAVNFDAARFVELDSDSDGTLNEEELAAEAPLTEEEVNAIIRSVLTEEELAFFDSMPTEKENDTVSEGLSTVLSH